MEVAPKLGADGADWWRHCPFLSLLRSLPPVMPPCRHLCGAGLPCIVSPLTVQQQRLAVPCRAA